MKRFLPLLAAVALTGLTACAAPDAAPPADVSTVPASAAADADAHARAAHRLAEQGRVDEALAALSQALAIDPAHPDALRDRALLRHAAGQHAEALADIDGALQRRPADARVLAARCVIRVAAERSDGGLTDCQRAQGLPGGVANGATALGQANLLLGRPAEALAGFERALAAAPRHMRALYGRGLARQALGDAAGAADVAEALRRLPGAGREFLVAASS